MKDQLTKASPSFQKAISHQLELMLANPIFNATPKRVAILKYVVSQTLAGKGRDIKDDMVAVEVFGRGQDFDQTVAHIVKIQTDILRRTLVRYYETTSKNEPIRIDIPKGTYVPVFKKRKLNEP